MSTEDWADRDTTEQAALFRALSDPTRLKMVKLLCSQKEPSALCVNALAGFLGVSQPAVSQHLRVLRDVGLVNGERRGYRVHYTINQSMLGRWQKLLLAALASSESHSCEPYCPDPQQGNSPDSR